MFIIGDANEVKGVAQQNDRWIEFKLAQVTMMFVFVACFSKRGRRDVQKYRLSQLKNPAIPDVFLHKFRLARTQSLKSFVL